MYNNVNFVLQVILQFSSPTYESCFSQGPLFPGTGQCAWLFGHNSFCSVQHTCLPVLSLSCKLLASFLSIISCTHYNSDSHCLSGLWREHLWPAAVSDQIAVVRWKSSSCEASHFTSSCRQRLICWVHPFNLIFVTLSVFSEFALMSSYIV